MCSGEIAAVAKMGAAIVVAEAKAAVPLRWLHTVTLERPEGFLGRARQSRWGKLWISVFCLGDLYFTGSS